MTHFASFEEGLNNQKKVLCTRLSTATLAHLTIFKNKLVSPRFRRSWVHNHWLVLDYEVFSFHKWPWNPCWWWWWSRLIRTTCTVSDEIIINDNNLLYTFIWIGYPLCFVQAWSKIDELITVVGIHQNAFIIPSFSHFRLNEKILEFLFPFDKERWVRIFCECNNVRCKGGCLKQNIKG